MKHSLSTSLVAVLIVASGCNTGESGTTAAQPPGDPEPAAPAVTFKPGADAAQRTAKISGPVSIAYRVIGEPLVGQPLTIELRISSAFGPQPVRVEYRIVDESALQLAPSQLQSATVEPGDDTAGGTEQVTVVPQREGRLYLNVAASVETGEGAMSTVTAIPIQVGKAAVTPDAEKGAIGTDASGEAVRVLSGSED